MSVRRRRWFTSKQIQTWAKRIASRTGEPEDHWRQHRKAAAAELSALLRRASDKDSDALATLKRFPPQEAWVVDYVDQGGTRCFATFEHKKAADDYHASVKVEVRRGTHIAPSKSPTVAEAAETWIRRVDAEGRERATIRQYRQHVDIHIAPRIGRLKLSELTPTRVEAFRDDLLKDLSRPMARKVLASLKSLLKVCKHGHVADDVTIGIDKRANRLEDGRDYPTPAEVKRLIEAAPDSRLRALLLTATMTGLRASELRGLRWRDVDLNTGELRVNQRADRFGHIGSPKSKSSRRTIPLDSDVLIPALKAWQIACPPNGGDLVFPTSSGRVEAHASIYRRVANVMIATGIVDKAGEPKYAVHALRHFFASWCLNPKDRGGRGLQPAVVQSWLGHSSSGMTQDVYGHLFPRGDDRAELSAAARALFA